MRIRQASGGTLVLACLLSIAPASSARAAIINGDFETGDLTGWIVSAIDGSGNPVTPLISVGTEAGNNFAIFDTGDFATGPFISTLEQSFLVDPATPFLTFDFSGPFTTSDLTGTGTSPFLDAFVVSLQSGSDFFELLLLDQNGPLADPFGTAPGTVALGVPIASGFDFTLRADLSSLAGQNVTLFADMINEDDGFQTTVWLDEVDMQAALREKSVIPEPSSMMLWSLLLLSGAGTRWWQHRRNRAVKDRRREK